MELDSHGTNHCSGDHPANNSTVNSTSNCTSNSTSNCSSNTTSNCTSNSTGTYLTYTSTAPPPKPRPGPQTTQEKIVHLSKFVLVTVLRLSWMIVNHVMYFPVDLFVLLLMQPVRRMCPEVYYAAEGYLYRWILALVAAWGWAVGHTVLEYGENVYACTDSRSILLCNHQTTADVPVLMGILQNKGKVVNHMMWIMDRIFKWTHFGWVANIHGDYFIQQGKEGREQELILLGQHVKDWYYPRDRKWVVLYPEGGFLYKRRVKSQQFARKNGLPVLEHVTLPRVGALQVLLQTMSRQQNGVANGNAAHSGDDRTVKYIIDVTIGYADQDPLDFWTFAVGTSGCKVIHVYYRYYHVNSVPQDTEPLTQWLYDRFVEKEILLDHLYKYGTYPKLKNHVHDHELKLDGSLKDECAPWLVALHICFSLAGCVFYTVMGRVWAAL